MWRLPLGAATLLNFLALSMHVTLLLPMLLLLSDSTWNGSPLMACSTLRAFHIKQGKPWHLMVATLCSRWRCPWQLRAFYGAPRIICNAPWR